MAKSRSFMDQRTRETAREAMRARHVLKAMKRDEVPRAMKDAFIKARFGDIETMKRAKRGEGDAKAASVVTQMYTYAPRSVSEQALKDGNPYIKRSASFQANCDHKFIKLTSEWKQCKRCAWCKPRIPEDQMLRLPPILEGRDLPPLSEDQQWVNMRKVHTLAGIVLSKRVRARQVQYTFSDNPYIKRYSIEVKFKPRDAWKGGWMHAGIFFETEWYAVLPVLQEASKNPKKLWRAIQKRLGHKWTPPWMTPPRLIPLAERRYNCGDCSFSEYPIGFCSHHDQLFRKYDTGER